MFVINLEWSHRTGAGAVETLRIFKTWQGKSIEKLQLLQLLNSGSERVPVECYFRPQTNYLFSDVVDRYRLHYPQQQRTQVAANSVGKGKHCGGES